MVHRMGIIEISNKEPVESISFIVLGEPAPEGSTRAFYIPKAKRTVVTHQNQTELDAWRSRVATEAQNVLNHREWTSDRASAYTVDVDFILPRPPSVPPHRRFHPTVRPDVDKLVRAINDALTGILFPDDCQVVSLRVTKDYDEERRPGAYLQVCRYQNMRDKRRRAKKEAKGD